jgi:hypothetical protein
VHFTCSTSHLLLAASEREILSNKDDRYQELNFAESREELEKAILVRMQSVTKAQPAVCIALLEENQYDLKTSVEAFFQS